MVAVFVEPGEAAMQLDMHYYGTYALARAAGVRAEIAMEIARAAQWVDDSVTVMTELQDAGYVDFRATAHGTSLAIRDLDDTVQNINGADQRRVWVPFHFLPGNVGDTLAERLLCQKDGPVVRRMLEHHLTQAVRPGGVALVGIAAHVYADTFAHYGFSGISHELNKVRGASIALEVEDPSVREYIRGKAQTFWQRISGAAAERLTELGHGAVATYPDRPYLRWHFSYEDGRESSRDNQADYLLGCEGLYGFFDQLDGLFKEGDGVGFGTIRAELCTLLAVEGDLEARIAAWQAAVQAGRLYPNTAASAIPDYDEDAFRQAAAKVDELRSANVADGPLGDFMHAAQVHRTYVLGELLPGCGLHAVFP